MSQTYYFNHYTVEDGLSNNTVLSSLQDVNGFMWFGTRDGLNRFDGYAFKNFANSPADSPVLQSGYIKVLKEDSRGKIWVGTDQGIYLFDPLSEEYSRPIPVNGDISDISEDSRNNIWFVSDMKLYKYDHTSVPDFPVLNENLTSFTFTGDGNEIIASSNKGEILYCSLDGRIIERYNAFLHTPGLADKWIKKLLPTKDSLVIIGTRKFGIKILNLKSGVCTNLIERDYKNETILVRDIVQKTENEFWFATESGIIQYNFLDGKIYFLTKEAESAWALSDNAVYTLCRDKEGAIWAGTYFGGVNYFSEKNNFFEKFYPKTNGNSISGFAVREITDDKYGNIWIGTEDNGLAKLYPSENRFSSFLPSLKHGSIAHSNIHGLMASGDTLWIGTFEHGLDWMDIRTGKVIKHFNADDKKGTLRNNFIFNIIKTRKGEILLATGGGLYRYQPETTTFKFHEYFPDQIFYTTLFEDDTGTIWAGTWRNGLYFFNPQTGNTGNLLYSATNSNGLRSNRINKIFQDRKGNIWVATEGGLTKIENEGKKFTNYTMKEGLPSNLILGLLEDNKGLLWISTTKGMVRMDPVTGSINVFTKANGLLSNQFNYNSSFQDSIGRMYFGTVKGMIRFDPLEFTDIQFKAPVFITGLQISNREAKIGGASSPLNASITFTSKISLRYNQSTFSIDFAALSFAAPAMTEYAYKMDGLDKEWNHLKTNRKVYFTNLSPGSYNFRVNVVDAAGNFIGKETTLRILISPPFWASVPAYLAYLVFGLFGIFLLVRNYDRRIKERNRRRLDTLKYQREKSLYQAKIDFFTQIVHEIRTPLTMIKAPLEKVIMSNLSGVDVEKNLKLIEKSTDRLITLSGQLLDFRKVEAEGFSLSFKPVNVNTVLLENFRSFQLYHRNKELKFDLVMPENVIDAELDEEAFVKIIMNLLDNASKYCDNFVRVELAENEADTFTILFENDGVPVPEHLREKIFEPFYRVKKEAYRQGTGIGLALSRSLAELLNGNLALKVSDDDMNIFILTLPKKQRRHEY